MTIRAVTDPSKPAYLKRATGGSEVATTRKILPISQIDDQVPAGVSGLGDHGP